MLAGKLADGYKPVGVPNALRVIQGNLKPEEGVREMEQVVIVDRQEMKLLAIHIKRNGHEVRRAWKELQAKIKGISVNREFGYVLIPEWQWPTEVTQLWVAVEVVSFDRIPEGLQTIVIPAKKYAKITVRGDRPTMDQTYGYLWNWFENSGYERDMSEGSLGFEANRLQPVNPFEIDADKIDYFDFDIYAPIKQEG